MAEGPSVGRKPSLDHMEGGELFRGQENIRDAIREYLEAVNETFREAEVREIEVSG